MLETRPQPYAAPEPAAVKSGGRVDAPHPLPLEYVQRFHANGFLVLPWLCDAGELVEIRGILMDLFRRKAGREEGNQFDMLGLDQEEGALLQPQLIKPSLYTPALQRTRYFRRVQAAAQQLLGPGTEFSFDHSILKPAGRMAATPWHQDEAHRYDPDRNCQQISFWMPLQDVTEYNGCMRYVPGSHLGELLPHHSPGDDPRVHALECLPEYVDESAALAQPVPAGWCILHAGRTLHGALPNHSTTQDRLAYIVSFRGPMVGRRELVSYSWLQEKRTPAALRHQHWRRRGGSLVLVGRWLGRMLKADVRSLPGRAAGMLRRLIQGSSA